MEQLLTVEQAGERLGLRPATIRGLIRRGELPVVRPARRAVRVPLAAVEAIIRLGRNPQIAVARRAR